MTIQDFIGPSREWYQPSEFLECECDEHNICDVCLLLQYDEDYFKDPNRARDEKIDKELEEQGADCHD